MSPEEATEIAVNHFEERNRNKKIEWSLSSAARRMPHRPRKWVVLIDWFIDGQVVDGPVVVVVDDASGEVESL